MLMLLLRAMGNGRLVKLVNNAIAARKTATASAQDFQAATGSPDADAPAAAVSPSKAYSPPEAKESSSKAREEISAVQKMKVKNVADQTALAFVASYPSEHSLAFDIECISKGSAKTAAMYRRLKKAVKGQKKERANTNSTVVSEPASKEVAKVTTMAAIPGAAETDHVGLLGIDGVNKDSIGANGAATDETAGESVEILNVDGAATEFQVTAERAAAEIDASKKNKICWLCQKPEDAVELRLCRGCHWVN